MNDTEADADYIAKLRASWPTAKLEQEVERLQAELYKSYLLRGFAQHEAYAMVYGDVIGGEAGALGKSEASTDAVGSNMPRPGSTPGADQPQIWRCFHCDEVCTDHATALEHFGIDRHCDPICKVDRAEYRRMEIRHIASVMEETELHLALDAKTAEMIRAVREAEEKGYERGLADGRALGKQTDI